MAGLSQGNGLSDGGGLALTGVGLWSGQEGLYSTGSAGSSSSLLTDDAGTNILTDDAGANLLETK